MFLSDLSIKRPVFASVLMLSLLTLGIFSYRRLAVDMFPNIEFPLLSIVVKYPGASPDTVEREVTRRIEEVINPIPGVKKLMSSSREGVSQVVVEFQLEIKINQASEEARAKISAIRNELPKGIEDPIIQKMDITGIPIVSLAVRSTTLSAKELTRLAERRVKRRLENLSGVGKIDLVGTSKREVQILVDPSRLETLGMGVDEVVRGLQSENVNTPLGRITRDDAEAPVRVQGKPEAVDGFGRMVVAQRDGRPISLGEVAAVVDGVEEQRSLALVNGDPAVALDILKQSGANTVEVVDRVIHEVGRLQDELPAGTRIEIVRNASVMIRESLRDVQTTILLGGLLTVFIVFCFLNSWRSTVITGLTLPISVTSSFIAMHFLGMTLNVLTLMALSLAIGMLIDDAIVVRENIVRHLEHGEDHFTAARKGTSEIGLAVLATSFSIQAVFVPVAFMKGIIGRFFFEFGLTVAFAVLVSLIVSFTLDPMLSSRWHDPDIDRSGRRHFIARILDSFNNGFDRMADRYKGLIGWALDHRKTVLVTAVLAFFAGMTALGRLQSEFMPEFDRGEFQVNFRTAPHASFVETRNRLAAVLAALKAVPEIQHTYATIGAGDSGTVRDGSVYIKLTDKSARKRIQETIRQDVRARLLKVPGLVLSVEAEVGSFAQKPLRVSVRGDDIPTLKSLAAQLKNELYRIPGLVDIDVSMEYDAPEYRLVVNRERAADAGVNTDDISRTVGALVGGQVVGSYEDDEGEAIDVRVRVPHALRETVTGIGDLRLSLGKPATTEAASLLPLGDLVTYQRSATPTQIDRQALAREVVVSANLADLPLGTAVRKIEEAAAQLHPPPGYRIVIGGEAEDMAESFGYMGESLLLAIVFVYLILAAQFESFIDPLAIMLSLPLSILGMAGMLLITGDTVNIMSLIGLIMLMGLVTKNAILLVDFAKTQRRGGMNRRDALIKAGRTRLRPILMTTSAMILGMAPLALGIGQGAEMRAPMGRAVIGGLITSTLLTLLVVPVVYSILDDVAGWLLRRRVVPRTAPAAPVFPPP